MVHLIKWATNENQARMNARETVFKLNVQSPYRRVNCFDVTCSFDQSSFSYEKGIFKVQRQSTHLSFVSFSWINGHQNHSSWTMQRRPCKWSWKADSEGGFVGCTVSAQGRWRDSGLQPFCLKSSSRSNYTVITPTTHLGTLASFKTEWVVIGEGWWWLYMGVCVTEGVKGNGGSTWMEIKVEILDCENCHSRGHV